MKLILGLLVGTMRAGGAIDPEVENAAFRLADGAAGEVLPISRTEWVATTALIQQTAGKVREVDGELTFKL